MLESSLMNFLDKPLFINDKNENIYILFKIFP